MPATTHQHPTSTPALLRLCPQAAWLAFLTPLEPALRDG